MHLKEKAPKSNRMDTYFIHGSLQKTLRFQNSITERFIAKG